MPLARSIVERAAGSFQPVMCGHRSGRRSDLDSWARLANTLNGYKRMREEGKDANEGTD